MKYAVLTLAVLLMACTPLRAEPKDVSSEIVHAVVYQDRALVTRRAQVQLAEGVHELRLAGLPGTIEADSVTAKGAGQAKVLLFGAKLVSEELQDAAQPRIKDLEAEIEKLSDRFKDLSDRQRALQEKGEFLASVRAATAEQIGKDIVTKLPLVDEVARLVEYLSQELQSTYAAANAAEVEKREVSKQTDRLRRELEKLYGEGRKQKAHVVVELQAQTAGPFTLEVSYRLPGASWEPLYEARSVSGSPDIQLNLFGTVRQRTGEDWENVTVQLSSATPSASGHMPEIQPWFLEKWDPPAVPLQVRTRAKMMLAKEMAETDAVSNEALQTAASAPIPEKKAQMAVAEVESKGTAVLYKLAAAQTVLSDWQPKKMSVVSHSLPASIAYETTPKLSPYVYLRAKVKNQSQTLFLPGTVQVFLDGAFVGSSWIPLVGLSEEFNLYLGTDERIRVERRPMKAKADVSVIPGLHGRIKTVDYDYLTVIENYLDKEAELTVVDQIPVSNHDEIKVENVVFEPAPSEKDKEKPGVVRWVLKIPAGAKQNVRLAYRVKHPVDFVVSGI